MTEQAWYEQFKDKLQGLSTDSEDSENRNESLLARALKENLISSEEYLLWACQHFGLPTLKQEFFTENSFPQELYSKWATQYSWSSECLPVAEWDGTLIVACLQPPEDFPKQLIPATFVLAAYSDIQSYFRHIETEGSTNEAPVGLDIPAAPSKPSLDFSMDNLFAGAEAPAEEEAIAPAPEELPDGILGAVKPVNPEADILPAVIPPPPQLHKIEAPLPEEKASPEQEQPVAKKATPPPPPADALHLLKVIADDQEEVIITPLSSVRIPETKEPEKRATPAAKATSEASSEVPEDTISQVAPVPVAEKSSTKTETPLQISYNSQITTKFGCERLKKKNGASFTKKLEHTFAKMKDHFPQVMVLAIDDEQKKLLPFAWDESFSQIKDLNNSVPLGVPSIFNIVLNTQKPFHGYISINEVNEKFFDDWNQNTIPDHVTITPIIDNEQLVGMLLGMGDKKSYTKNHLNLAELVSSDFMVDLKAA